MLEGGIHALKLEGSWKCIMMIILAKNSKWCPIPAVSVLRLTSGTAEDGRGWLGADLCILPAMLKFLQWSYSMTNRVMAAPQYCRQKEVLVATSQCTVLVREYQVQLLAFQMQCDLCGVMTAKQKKSSLL